MKLNRILRRRSSGVLAVAVLAVLSAGPLAAVTVAYQITVNSSSVSGTPGFLDFQFNPGNSTSQPAKAQILMFNADGGVLIGPPQVAGNVTGTLPGKTTFVNSSALNEYFQQFKYGPSFSFVLLLSGPALDSPNGVATAGTTFGLGLYDSAQNPILTNQSSNTGFAGQIDINLNGTTTVTAFPNANNGPSAVTVAPFSVDYFQARYASNLNIADSYVDVTNTGASGGNLCVNLYTFDPAEELISCCTCAVTPNGLQSLSVLKSLISNPLTPAIPTSVVIKMVASSGTCNASTVNAGSLALGLRAWGTSVHAQPTAPVTYGITETPFLFSELSAAELAHITSTCGFIQSNGSGFGICKGCAAGGLGAQPSTR